MTPVVFIFMALSALLAWGIGAWLCRRAAAVGLVQAPNHRSLHVQPTPTGGGLGFVMAASVAGMGLALLYGWPLGWGVLGLAAVLAGVGLRDDICHVSARVRFGAQVLVVGGFLPLLGVLGVLGGLPGLDLPWPGGLVLTGWGLATLLLLAGVWWVNLFNFMDGVDGIAAAQAVFMLLMGALMAAVAHPGVLADAAWMFMLTIAVAVGGFLLLNWPPARIFMGDVGSTWLGFVIFALALITVQKGWLNYAAWVVMAAVFVVDATVTLLTRLARGERWYEAHRSHAFQRLCRRWQGERKAGHRAVTLLFIAVNLLWAGPWAWACLQWPQWSMAFVGAAYAPLVLVALSLGAGKPDPVLPDDGCERN